MVLQAPPGVISQSAEPEALSTARYSPLKQYNYNKTNNNNKRRVDANAAGLWIIFRK